MNRIETLRCYPVRIANVIQAGAIVTLCIGGGQGIALALETV